jgi:hypothetical protein
MGDVYIACAVDLTGRILAQCALNAADDETANQEAESVLAEYPVIEVWQKHRRIGRIVRRGKLERPKAPSDD